MHVSTRSMPLAGLDGSGAEPHTVCVAAFPRSRAKDEAARARREEGKEGALKGGATSSYGS
jgi:hypothetical protein